MRRSVKATLQSVLTIGLVLACSVAVVTPTQAQRGGGGSGAGAGGGGGGARGGSMSRGGGGISRSGGSPSGMSRIGGGMSHGGMSRSGSSHGGYGGQYHAGGGYRSGEHHGGRGRSSLYFSPYGFGYGYYGRGLSIYFGGPIYGYYDYYSRYSDPGYYAPTYVDASSGDGYAVTESTSSPIIAAAGAAAEHQLQAEQAFRAHNYEDAVRFCSHAIVEDGANGKLHLFASQALFAVGDYRAAAGALQRGASLLEQGEWGYVVENYRLFYRGNDYVTQMESLVSYIKENPDAAYARVVRGHQYAFLGHKEAAKNELARAVALESRDRLAADLLAMVSGEAPSASPGEEIPLPAPTDEMPEATATPK